MVIFWLLLLMVDIAITLQSTSLVFMYYVLSKYSPLIGCDSTKKFWQRIFTSCLIRQWQIYQQKLQKLLEFTTDPGNFSINAHKEGIQNFPSLKITIQYYCTEKTRQVPRPDKLTGKVSSVFVLKTKTKSKNSFYK